MRGLALRSASYPMPSRSLTSGRKFSTTTSAFLARPQKDLATFVFLEIKCQRTLIAMQIEHVVAVARTAHALVRIDPRRSVDFENVGAKIRKDTAASRARARPRQVKHA